MSNIIFTVVIDAFNYGHFIEEAITSALQQTLSRDHYEVIIVDDGSTDDTEQRVSKYLPDVKYIYKENGGQASAFNTGISAANGEFIAFLDADDYWYPDKLESVLEMFESDSSVDVLYNVMNVGDVEGNFKCLTPLLPDNPPYADRPIEFSLKHVTPGGNATSGIVWRKSALEKLLPIPEAYMICADAYLMACAPVAARKFVLISKALGCYRIHGNNHYSTFSLTSSALCAKSCDVDSYYLKLIYMDLKRLYSVIGLDRNVVTNELKALCLADDFVNALKNASLSQFLLRGISFFKALTDLPVKLSFYRLATTILRLFLPSAFYARIQQIYACSQVRSIVQSYVRDDQRIVLQHSILS